MGAPVRVLACDILERPVASGAEAHALADSLRALGVFDEVVPARKTVTVQFDPHRLDPAEAHRRLSGADTALRSETPSLAPLVIAVRYGGEDGPDLEAVAAASGLSAVAAIDAHLAGTYGVEALGFTPGFAYLSGLDSRLRSQRLETPRTRVAPGAVGVITGSVGLYALGGPGGWPIIGRTETPLFRGDRKDPFVLGPGRSVRFERAR